MRNSQTRYVEPPADAIYPKETENLIAWSRTASGRVITLTVEDEHSIPPHAMFFRVPYTAGFGPRHHQRMRYTLIMRKNGRRIFAQRNMQRGCIIPQRVVMYLDAPSQVDLVKGLSDYHW